MAPAAIPSAVLSLTLDEALTDLLAAYRAAGRAPATIEILRDHATRLTLFVAPLGITLLDEVKPRHVSDFIAAERDRGLKESSLSVSLRSLRRFFQYHVDIDNLDVNPARKVIAPRVVVEPVRFLSDSEMARLYAACDTKTVEGLRDFALLHLAADTGLRRSELVGLRVTDVDLTERVVVVRPMTSKSRKGRVVPFSTDTQKALRLWLKARDAYEARRGSTAGDALWVSAKGALNGNGAWQALERRLNAAGLPHVTLHSLRHRFAARAVERGLPMPYLVKMGGWANAKMPSERYGQWGVESRALDAMKALLDAPTVRS